MGGVHREVPKFYQEFFSNVSQQHPILAITIARLREFIRRPESVFWVYMFPLLMVVVLGSAFRNQTAEKFDVDVVNSSRADELVKKLTPNLRLKLNQIEEAAARNRLRTGKTNLLVVSQSDSANPSSDSALTVEYVFDPSRPGSLTARNLVDDQLQRASGRVDVVTSTDVSFSEPGGRYVDFLVPGLLAMGLMGGGLWGVGFAIVDMRIRKLLKRLMATPMKRTDFLMGVMNSRLIFMVPQIALLLLFSYWVFGVKVYGNWFSIMLVVLIGAVEFSVIGLLVAARAQTMETVSGLMNLVMLPMYTLCGIFFSYERFPAIVHPLIRWLPLTPVIDSLRALMLDGKSIFSLGPELAVMTFWCVVPFAIALWIFRWND